MTIARACAGVGLSRAAWYRPRINWALRDAPVVDGVNAALAKNGRWGFGLCFDGLRNGGAGWNPSSAISTRRGPSDPMCSHTDADPGPPL